MSRFFALLMCVGLFPASVLAQPASVDKQIPAALKDWSGWVLKGLEYRTCPFIATQAPNSPSDFFCAWPGRLALDAKADGVNFSIAWQVQAESWIALPGDTQFWPQLVTVNGKREPVLVRGDVPSVWLSAGNYTIAGRIPWKERPQSLRVPGSIGLVALSVDGKPIVPLLRNGEGITLGRSTVAVPEADSLQLRVYRELEDGVPATLNTQLQLNVSGQAREETLGPVLPAGFVPISVAGEWPARLDDDGRLHVQVQPGYNVLTVQARATQPLADITTHLPPAPWPKQEIWSYASAPRLRVTVASGATQVDPRQAQVPEQWTQLPAFALGDAATLKIEERSRGAATNEGNRLNLHREAWLDFSGAGWYAKDRVQGQMVQGWRLDVAAPFTLERADAMNSVRAQNGVEPMLITRGAAKDLSGVEWRAPAVNLDAGVRIASSASSLPVAGWQQTFDRVDETLHFPYGYKLLAAPGADSASGSWMSRWTLLDAFVCAIAALLAWRLFGIPGAAITVVYLALGYHEFGSPVWSLIVVFAIALIARALPAGKLERSTEVLRRVALGILILISLPFVADQVRYALYPQLEQSSGFAYFMDKFEPEPAQENAQAPVMRKNAPQAMSMPAAPPAPAQMAGSAESNVAKSTRRLETSAVTGSTSYSSDLVDHYDQSTVIQTGSGEPSWNLGSQAMLSWTGPVLKTQTVHLLVAPPWLVRPLRIVLVALLAWLLWRLFAPGVRSRSVSRRTMGTAFVMLAAVAAAAVAPAAHAQGYPSDELLQQLRARLIEAPKCAPTCASVPQAQVAANGDVVTVAVEADAAQRVALPLPDADAATVLQSIKVDGRVESNITRSSNGTLWIALDRGVHRIDIDYRASADKVALSFALRPARVLFQGDGWKASGLGDDRLQTDTLSLTRARASATGKPTAGVQQFPPYVRVNRSISLGLDWNVQTGVERISPAQGGFTVQVPVLPGEHVQTADIKVHDKQVSAAIDDGQTGTSWSGTLDKGDSVTLTAPKLGDRAEVWHVLVSPIWHVEFSGVPGVASAQGASANDYRNFEFHPLPGETLTLKITRPVPVAGSVRAIDSVNLMSDSGQHASTHTVSLQLRASQGGEQEINVPAGDEVLSVARNGQTLNLRPQAGKLSLPVVPGTQHFDIRFRDAQPQRLVVRTPLVALGLPAANVNLQLALPADRWLLATWGPTVGPAVLYWGELAVMILVALGLSRTRRTRLKFHHWLLLGLGFSTFSWGALLVVVVWLFTFDWRANNPQPAKESLFNLSQIGLALLTLIALACLISAIPQGLLGQPDMHVTGNGSTAHALRWFIDRSTDALPQASAISVPLWVYKVLMLAWALWLANALIGWLRDGFAAWTKDGYWRVTPKPAPAVSAMVETPTEPAKNR
ncbi:MAG: hypothetical protein ABI304_09790 [Rudaea sp.]